MNEWIDELFDLCADGEHAVLVTVAGIRGSAPREIGAKMIVTADQTIGTIGGGQLEYECTRLAVGMLDKDAAAMRRSFPLGAAMGQCCGGVVDVLFEPFAGRRPSWLSALRALYDQRVDTVLVTSPGDTARKSLVTADSVVGHAVGDAVTDAARRALSAGGHAFSCDGHLFDPVTGSGFNIAVFGAGHVGSAVVDVLSRLDCNIRWIDSRRNIFGQVPRKARAIESGEPALEVAAMPAGSFYLVMTHSHALDFDICSRILARRDAAYAGLIGSRSKRRRFEKRFVQQGLPAALVETLVCPIGVGGISGKKPAEIAIAVAAELLQARERAMSGRPAQYPSNVTPFAR